MRSRFRPRLLAAALAPSIAGVLGIPAEEAPLERRLQNSAEQVVRGQN